MKSTGFLFVNLGSPSSPHVEDVRNYLEEFLMDPYVIDVPYLVRKIIVHGFILPFRPKRSAEAYRSVWSEEGSPLLVISQRFFEKMVPLLKKPAALAMRYGKPSIATGVESLHREGVNHIILVPLYPHYAMSTTRTVVDKTREILHRHYPGMTMEVIPPFYNHPSYIAALAESIKPFVEQQPDYILFSYHGLPLRHLLKTDPTRQHCLKVKNCCKIASPAHQTCYKHQTEETTRLVAERLNLKEGTYSIAYQSRLGKDSWLSPMTDQEIIRLARNGIKSLAVACPAFVADCLETLEEIGIRGKELFLNNGGKRFMLVPCLNDFSFWINAMQQIIDDYVQK